MFDAIFVNYWSVKSPTFTFPARKVRYNNSTTSFGYNMFISTIICHFKLQKVALSSILLKRVMFLPKKICFLSYVEKNTY